MDESINVEKKQNHLKPPLSRPRIACEILAGTATGLAVVPPVYAICCLFVDKDEYAVFEFLGMFVIVCPLLYGLASAVGVYLLGNIGKQTGSFLLTIGYGFLGGLVMLVMLPVLYMLALVLIVGVERIILWAFGVLILLIPPIITTIGFNSTSRYKEPPSS
jgi:hypothetical protein